MPHTNAMLISAISIDHLQNHFLPGTIGITHDMHYYVTPSATHTGSTTVTQVASVDYRSANAFEFDGRGADEQCGSFYLVADRLSGTSRSWGPCWLIISSRCEIRSTRANQFECKTSCCRRSFASMAFRLSNDDGKEEIEHFFFDIFSFDPR
jgi:hypothetical protein